jgi:Arm DNA-binding domain
MNGSVYRRDGKRAYQIEAGVHPATGKRGRPSKSGFTTKSAATQAMREAIRALELGVTTPGATPNLAAFVDEWLAGRRASLRASTWCTRTGMCSRAASFPVSGRFASTGSPGSTLPTCSLSSPEHGGRDQRRGPGLSATTVGYTLSVLGFALADAVKRGLIPRNPAQHVDRPRAAKPDMRWWNADDARTFLDYTAADRLSALWTLALTSGMRRGELLGLK